MLDACSSLGVVDLHVRIALLQTYRIHITCCFPEQETLFQEGSLPGQHELYPTHWVQTNVLRAPPDRQTQEPQTRLDRLHEETSYHRTSAHRNKIEVPDSST